MSPVLPNQAPSDTGDEIDPITFSVISNRLDAIATEMTLALEKTAWTSVLALARDFSCAVYDAHGDGPRQLSMYEALPIHTNSMHAVLGEIADAFAGEIYEGDVFACNSPFHGNTHTPDLVTARPVFVDGRHAFWAIARGHQLDTGAMTAASVVPAAKNVWQEGIQIPPIKLWDRGVERRDIVNMYLANVRYQDSLRGDLMAQLGCIAVAERALVELCQEYDVAVVLRYCDELIEYAHRRTAEEIASIPDGEYTAVTWSDSDGLGATDMPIRVKVTVEGHDVTVDYSGSAPPSKGSANATYATMTASAAIPFLYYIDPDIPHNSGALRHIRATAEPGTICLAEYPAATGGATQNPADAMHDVVNIAMAQAIPDRVPAGGPHTSHIPTFSGLDGEGKEWACMLFNSGGGSGGASGADGWPLIQTIAALGGLKSLPVEQIELLYPLRFHQMEVETDSMGLGEFIGGPGLRTRFEPTAGDMECVTIGEGCANPAHGILGGTAGIGGGQYVQHADDTRTYTSAAAHVMVRAGEEWVGVSGGGGGWGDPRLRPAEQVRLDTVNGMISKDVAHGVFGVVLRDDDEWTLDVDATEQLRNAMSERERPQLDPTVPGASTWSQTDMRDGDTYLLNPVLD